MARDSQRDRDMVMTVRRRSAVSPEERDEYILVLESCWDMLGRVSVGLRRSCATEASTSPRSPPSFLARLGNDLICMQCPPPNLCHRRSHSPAGLLLGQLVLPSSLHPSFSPSFILCLLPLLLLSLRTSTVDRLVSWPLEM